MPRDMCRGLLGGLSIAVALLSLSGCGQQDESPPTATSPAASAQAASGDPQALTISYPFDGTVFPPEFVPPAFRWQDSAFPAQCWQLTFAFGDGGAPLEFVSESRHWTPSPADWEAIKQRSQEATCTVTVEGVRTAGEAPVSLGTISFTTSADPVGAPIFYREVNLPFREAVKDPAKHIRWRFGTVDSAEQPPVVLQQLPACGNCHSFSADGSVMGMDVDYANDKGSYAITRVQERMVLNNDSIISWADFQKDDHRKTFGLLSQVSPDGRYVISTVKDLSVFRPVDNLTFSQLFFPVRGILCLYDRQTGQFQALPGADDEAYVQSNATWSPDGKYIVFARTKALEVPKARVNELGLTRMDEMPDFVKQNKGFRFDLYRMPFNEGRGGVAEPLAGASQNGRSNYFARYSPDGKWIVFCQANSYMLLQPDSELFIIPAAGGEARRLAGNRKLMNSWHSWSPNSRWLVFSSKVFTPYTQLFLTHIDESGESSPPVLLSHFTSSDMAANIPEFVNASPAAIAKINDAFAEDLHYVRIGDEHGMRGEDELAVQNFRKALEINPQCASAYRLWGVLLLSQGKPAAAEKLIRKSIALEEYSHYSYWNLAKVLAIQNRNNEALQAFQRAIELNPKYAPIRRDFASFLLSHGQADLAREQMLFASQLDD